MAVERASAGRAAEPGTRIARNSAWNVAGWLALTLLSFFSAPFFLARLGPEHFGLLALLTAAVTPLGLLEFGMGDATVKYVAESVGREDWTAASRFLGTALAFNLLVGLAGSAVILGLAGFLLREVFEVRPADQELALACVAWVALTWMATRIRLTFVGAAMALRDFRAVSTGNFAYQLVYVLAGVGALAAGGGLREVVIAQAVAAVGGAAGWYGLIHRLAPALPIRVGVHVPALRQTFGFGSWQLGNQLGDVFVQQAQRWQLGAVLSTAVVGYYNLAYQLGSLVYAVSARVSQVFFPEISRLHGLQRETDATQLLVKVNWLLSVIQVSGYVALFVWSDDLLGLWVGTETARETGGCLRVLCLGLGIASLFALPSAYLLGLGRPKWLALMAVGQGTITVTVAAVLIPRLGLVGAAWALTAGTVTHLVVLVLFWQVFLRPHVRAAEYVASTFCSLVCGLAIVALVQGAKGFFTLPATWPAVLAAGAATAVGCAVACLLASWPLPGGRARLDWLAAHARRLVGTKEPVTDLKIS